MASKRRERGPSRREKLMERQAYDSMEIALIEHQSDDTPEEEQLSPAQDDSPVVSASVDNDVQEASASAQTPPSDGTTEETALDAKAAEPAPAPAQEVAEDEEAAALQTESASAVAEDTNAVDEGDVEAAAETAPEAAPEVAKAEESVVIMDIPPAATPAVGLPQKTAHDPTSHAPEATEDTSDGAAFFWIFLVILALVGLLVMFKNG